MKVGSGISGGHFIAFPSREVRSQVCCYFVMQVDSWSCINGLRGKKIGFRRWCFLPEQLQILRVLFFLWLGVMGAVVAPLTFLGGPLLIRAAWYTAGIVGGLSTVAMCAPSEKFLNMGGPLGIGLGFVLASSIGKTPF